MKRVFLVIVALFLGAVPAFGQTSGVEVEIVDVDGSRYPEGGQTSMVVEFRNLAEDPDPDLLEVTADGEPVADLNVVPLGESRVPVGVVLAIDASGSMAGAPIEAAKAAAIQFVAQARPEDRLALITFADEVLVTSAFTSNKQALTERINDIEAVGETAFNDAVIKGVEMYDDASARNLLPNMIILTDGDDTVSVTVLAEALSLVAEKDVRIFGIALESSDFNPEPVEEAAVTSGGLFLSTPDPEQLSALYDEIGREISNTLVTRFVSPIFAPGDIEFAVSYQGLTASATLAVSGYTTTTTAGASTTTTLAPITTRVVESTSPLDTSTLILIGSAGLGLTFFLFLIILFARDDEDDPSRYSRRLAAYGRKGELAEGKEPFLQRIPLLKKFSQAAEEEVKKRGLLSGISSTLEQANVPLSPGEAILAMFGLASVGGAFVGVLNGLVVGAITFGILLLFFVFLINFAGGREKKKFEDQLPDTLTLLSTSLRAGYSLLQAAEAVASEAPNPTAREFGRAIAEARLGVSVSDAFDGIVERSRSKDFEWAVMAIEIQREVGGNLAEVLQTVADTMRARNRLKGEIRALTAEGRISALVLGALPVILFAFLWTTNRDYLEPLLTTTFGQFAIGAGVLLMIAGTFWLKKIVDIEI